MGTTLLIAILTKNASFRSYGTFAYLLRAHIRNINMCRYIASAGARGRELSGRVRADANNFAVLSLVHNTMLVRASRRERRERRERQFVNYPASVSVGERWLTLE